MADRSSTPSLAHLLAGFATSDVVVPTVTLAEHLPAAWPTHRPFQHNVVDWFADRYGQMHPVPGYREPYRGLANLRLALPRGAVSIYYPHKIEDSTAEPARATALAPRYQQGSGEAKHV